MIPIAKPFIGAEERAAVLEVLDSGYLVQGSRVQAFEAAFAAYCGVRHAVAVSSGTAALHTALLAAGVGPGDEVITTSFTFIASANAILMTGARPVFADIEPDTFNLDPEAVAAVITPRTKAILPVHLFGQPCDMDALNALAAQYGLVVIEDACQAHGAELHGRRVGGLGLAACFSFYPTKNMIAGEGGMVTTNDDGLAERARLIRNHGSSRRYYHEMIGYNYRMMDLTAAIGLVQLGRLEAWNEQRIANAAFLSAHLTGVVTPTVRPGVRHVFHQYTVRVPGGRRDELRAALRQAGIDSEVYYPVPVHQQVFYRKLGYNDHLPVTEQACQEVLSLPVHPALTRSDLTRIVEEVNRW